MIDDTLFENMAELNDNGVSVALHSDKDFLVVAFPINVNRIGDLISLVKSLDPKDTPRTKKTEGTQH